MARTARDCAIMLQVMAGYDPADASSVDVPVPDMLGLMDGSLAGVRIGVPRDYFFTVPELDAEVKAAVEAAIDQMAAAGATIVEVTLPHADPAWMAGRISSCLRGVRLPPAGPRRPSRSSTESMPAARSCSAACSAARTTSRRSGSARCSTPSARPCSGPRPTCWSMPTMTERRPDDRRVRPGALDHGPASCRRGT